MTFVVARLASDDRYIRSNLENSNSVCVVFWILLLNSIYVIK